MFTRNWGQYSNYNSRATWTYPQGVSQECSIGTVHYLRAGARDFEGGYLFLASRRWGNLFLVRKILKKPAKPISPCVSGQNKTKTLF